MPRMRLCRCGMALFWRPLDKLSHYAPPRAPAARVYHIWFEAHMVRASGRSPIKAYCLQQCMSAVRLGLYFYNLRYRIPCCLNPQASARNPATGEPSDDAPATDWPVVGDLKPSLQDVLLASSAIASGPAWPAAPAADAVQSATQPAAQAPVPPLAAAGHAPVAAATAATAAAAAAAAAAAKAAEKKRGLGGNSAWSARDRASDDLARERDSVGRMSEVALSVLVMAELVSALSGNGRPVSAVWCGRTQALLARACTKLLRAKLMWDTLLGFPSSICALLEDVAYRRCNFTAPADDG